MNRPQRELELTAQRQPKGASVRDVHRAEHRCAMQAPSLTHVESAKAASFLVYSEWAWPHPERIHVMAAYPQVEMGLKSEPISRDLVLLKQGWSLSHLPVAVLFINLGTARHFVNPTPLGHQGPYHSNVSDYWICQLPHADTGWAPDWCRTSHSRFKSMTVVVLVPDISRSVATTLCRWLCEPSAWRTPGLITCISIVQMEGQCLISTGGSSNVLCKTTK